MKKVIILDYGMGNLISVKNIFDYLGCITVISSNYKDIKKFSHIILPGVGAFKQAIKNLEKLKFKNEIIEQIKFKKKKILGICLGMQLLGLSSTEDGLSLGLNLIKNKVENFNSLKYSKLNFPHVGFNNIKVINNKNGFFKNISDLDNFYFNHNYRMLLDDFSSDYALCNYGENFLTAFNKDNLYGVQFHPEKSQSSGIKILNNFLI